MGILVQFGGEDAPYQKYDPELASKMEKIILKGSHNHILVCLPDVFKNMKRYNQAARNFYYEDFFYQNRKLLKKIQDTHNEYGSTFISRPYMDLAEKSLAGKYFNKLKLLWDNKDILIVEGKYSRSGEGNDLFSNSNSISRILVPPRDAFRKINLIESAIKQNAENKLILLMVGSTAKVIVDDLKNKDNFENQMIDIGHIDSEYEWFKMGAKTKVLIPHKHTAEHNTILDDQKIDLVNDISFNKQVICKID